MMRNGEMGWRDFPKGPPSPANKEDVVAEKPTEEEMQKVAEQAAAAGKAVGNKPVVTRSVAPKVMAPATGAIAPKVMIPPRAGSPTPTNVAKSLSPSSRQQAVKQVVVNDEFGYDVAFNMAFLGTGQGGSRIANAFYQLGYRRVAVMNTTDMDFAGIAEPIPKLNLAVGGAAKDPIFAANSLRGREEEVWDLMTRSWGNSPDYALICVGLGGGTGSGTTPILVDLARKYMESKGKPPRVGCIVSLPPTTEGQQVSKNAVQTFKTLLDMKVSPMLIIDNARIHELYKPGMTRLHATANETVSQLFHLFNQLAAVHSEFITFDRAEFAQLLDGGVVVLGAADIPVESINTPADISTRIREDLTNNVLATVDLKRGKKAACLFVGSQDVLDSLSLDYFDAGFTQLDRLIGSAYSKKVPTVIHRGLYLGAEPGLQCYTMISELDPPLDRLAELGKKGMLDTASSPKGVASFLGVQD